MVFFLIHDSDSQNLSLTCWRTICLKHVNVESECARSEAHLVHMPGIEASLEWHLHVKAPRHCTTKRRRVKSHWHCCAGCELPFRLKLSQLAAQQELL